MRLPLCNTQAAALASTAHVTMSRIAVAAAEKS